MDDSRQPSEVEKTQTDATRRRLRNIWKRETIELSSTPSWGERLLPLIFAAMETCWLDGILIALAASNFFGSREPLLPLWTPLILMAGSAWLVSYLERRELAKNHTQASDGQPKVTSGSSLLIGLLVLVTLISIWSAIYASSASLIDPRWLLGMLSDLLLLSPQAYHVLSIIALSVYFCWRGLTLARRTIEPGTVLRHLRIGIGIFVLVIIVRTSAGDQFYDELLLLFLLPCFIAFALIAHALARAIFVRQMHPVGLLGNVAVQEGAVLVMVGAISAILLLLALLLGTFASPAFLTQVHQALAPAGLLYSWLVSILAQITVFLLTPIFWLFSLLPHNQQLPRPQISSPIQPGKQHPASTPAVVVITVAILKVALPLLVIAGLCFLVWRLLRRRRVVLQRRDQDLHESVWSWQLFWTQLRGLLQALWLQLFARKQRAGAETPAVVEIQGQPTARSVREIYRALLKWAAGRGYPRKKDETPHEFQQRLHTALSQSEPELGTITEAYTLVRYGEVVPEESAATQIQEQWLELQQKMQPPQQ